MTNLIIAGFGGQGILFAGKLLATAGMMSKQQVSWLPSYGPEMRGGTANCSVCLDEEPICCPLVTNPNILITLNKPSFLKFAPAVLENGIIVFDDSLIDSPDIPTKTHAYGIPATTLAEENNLHGLANMIALGFAIKQSDFISLEFLYEALGACVPASKKHLITANEKALELGYTYTK